MYLHKPEVKTGTPTPTSTSAHSSLPSAPLQHHTAHPHTQAPVERLKPKPAGLAADGMPPGRAAEKEALFLAGKTYQLREGACCSQRPQWGILRGVEGTQPRLCLFQ